MIELIWLASIAGAIVFFAAGAVTILLRRREPRSAETALIQEAEAAIQDAMRWQVIDAGRQDEIEHLRNALRLADEAARDQQARLDEQITRVQRERSDAVTGRELVALRTEVERLGRELAAALATNAQLRPEAERRRDLEQQLAERVQSVRDLSTENEHLRGRVRDAEALRAEYVRLRTATIDSEFLKSEIARLEQELRRMRVDAVGRPRPRPARGTPRQATSPTRSIEESLSGVIERFTDSGTRSIAIGDAVGFPLASSGTDGLALAAYAALLFESATRARQFLPIAAPRAIEIIDDQGTRLSLWTFDVESERLLLANLAVTPVDAKRIEATLADLTAILAPSALANRFT